MKSYNRFTLRKYSHEHSSKRRLLVMFFAVIFSLASVIAVFNIPMSLAEGVQQDADESLQDTGQGLDETTEDPEQDLIETIREQEPEQDGTSDDPNEDLQDPEQTKAMDDPEKPLKNKEKSSKTKTAIDMDTEIDVDMPTANQETTYNGKQQGYVWAPPEGVTAIFKYKGISGTNYGGNDGTETKPKDAGKYSVTISVSGNAVKEKTVILGFEIKKKELQIKIDDKVKLYGEQNPILTYSASGFVNGESKSVLDDITLTTEATSASPVGKYKIIMDPKSKDNNYDLIATQGELIVNCDSADDLYTVKGVKGGNGHSDWYISKVTLLPDNTKGYDLMSVDSGVTWAKFVSVDSIEADDKVSRNIMLKKSSTGAVTYVKTDTFKICTKKLAAVSRIPANGAVDYDPSANMLSLTFDQDVESGRGYFYIYEKSGKLAMKVSCKSKRVKFPENNRIDIYFPETFKGSTEYFVTNDGNAIYSVYGRTFGAMGEGEWTFTTARTSDKVKIVNLLLDVKGESKKRNPAFWGTADVDYAAAVAPADDNGATGTNQSEFSIMPQVYGVLDARDVTLEIEDAKPVPGKTITTDDITVDGINIKMSPDVMTAKIKVTVAGAAGDSDSATIKVIQTGSILQKVVAPDGMNIEVSDIIAAIDPEILAEITTDQIVRFRFTANEVEPSAEELVLLKESAGDKTLGQFYDFRLYADIFNKGDMSTSVKTVDITETQGPLRISFDLPAQDIDQRNYIMAYIHGGTADTTDASLISASRISFETEEFSLYAAAYDKVYEINTKASAHGKVKADKTRAIKGETVKITAGADKGYKLRALKVNDKTIKAGKFTMPAGNVSVSAKFVKKTSKIIDDPDDDSDKDDKDSKNGRNDGGTGTSTGDDSRTADIFLICLCSLTVILIFAVRTALRRSCR